MAKSENKKVAAKAPKVATKAPKVAKKETSKKESKKEAPKPAPVVEKVSSRSVAGIPSHPYPSHPHEPGIQVFQEV